MIYQDVIYGSVEINQRIILDLMASKAMRRLKGVSQHGVTALLGITPPFSRFDHSVGVMLLVKRLGASLEEQIAALLHDVSHTAFSHVIDYVFDDHDQQGYHENKKRPFVAESDIPGILEQHGLDWVDYMDETRFSLLEQAAPALCADRVDYFLRDLEFLKLAHLEEITGALNMLVVEAGQMVVSDLAMARWMAYTYIEVDRASWSNFREVGLYQLTAEAIKAALKEGIIDELAIWGTDDQLWKKLCATDHPDVSRYIRLVTAGTRFIRDEDRAMFRISSKVRSIDPLVKSGNRVVLLSGLDPAFARYREAYHASKTGPWPMAVVSPE